MSYEYTIRIPASERANFRYLSKKLGWQVSGPKKMSAYERSKSEAKEGKVYSFDSLDKLFEALNA